MGVQLTSEQESELADIARQTERTTDDVAQEAVAQYLIAIAEHREAVARAREDVRQGRTVAHGDVVRRLNERMGW